jgi:pyruvate/2-oxoglutarate dehydrogenase complex dihydrolipoamide dehydrogenase (E3) component
MAIQLAVIGSGPAGIAAASAAADSGANVTLIGAEPPGGRAGWHSLVPSKALLSLADSLGLADRFARLGLEIASAEPDMGVLVQRIRALSQAQSDRQAADLARRGVQMLAGKAAFAGPRHLQVAAGEGRPTVLEVDAIIIATGSVPIFPPGLKPDGQRIIAPRFVSGLDHLPGSFIVVGGGVTGAEFVYGFNRLGATVHWVIDEFGVLPPFDRDVVGVLVDALAARGVVRYEGIAADSAVSDAEGVTVTLADGTVLRTEMAFMAIGRQPDLLELNLEKAGLYVDFRQGISVDGFGRSAVPSIYAAGDVTGPPMTANKAMVQGWIAGRHAAGAAVEPCRPETMIEAVYSEPQVAQVGLNQATAAAHGHPIRELTVNFDSGLKATLLDETEGLVKLWADAGDHTLLGAAAVGAQAADILAPVALGLSLGARLDEMAALFVAHPSLSELVFAAARQA